MFKWLEAKVVGSDTVIFRLEDGAMVKVKVDIDRAGVATDFRNPDGSLHYNVGASVKVSVVPAGKTFSIPKSELKIHPSPKPESKTGHLMLQESREYFSTMHGRETAIDEVYYIVSLPELEIVTRGKVRHRIIRKPKKRWLISLAGRSFLLPRRSGLLESHPK